MIDAGKIVERGTHQQLLAAGGLYAELYRTQHQPMLEGAAFETDPGAAEATERAEPPSMPTAGAAVAIAEALGRSSATPTPEQEAEAGGNGSAATPSRGGLERASEADNASSTDSAQPSASGKSAGGPS